MQYWFAIVAFATIVLAGRQPHLVLDIPGSVIYNEGLTGTCVAENSAIPPHVKVHKDYKNNCQIVSKKRVPGGSGGRTIFELINVNGTCVVQCFFTKTVEFKTITPVTDQGTKITSEPHNTTVPSGMPVTVSCTVKSNDLLYHQLLWMKGDVFVGIDDNHSLWFSQHDDNTKTYELTVHSVTESAPYTCMVMSTDGKVVSSVTQDVFVDVTEPEVSDLLKYLTQFFKWYKSD